MIMGGEVWLSVAEFAASAGIGDRSARAALSKGSWRGFRLETRPVHGRGGRSGLAYQVSLSSLSAALQKTESDGLDFEPWPDLEPGGPLASADQSARMGMKHRIVLEVVEGLQHGWSRAELLKDAAARAGASTRTVERWLQAYQRGGVAALGHARPSNAGNARVHVSRAFDKAFLAAGYPAEQLAELRAEVEANLKGLWKGRSEIAGGEQVRRHAEFLLLEACEARGFRLPPAALRLSRRHVERFAAWRMVNVMKTDRKRFDDAKPRIRRDWTGLAPMERVIADVHPVDVYLQRPDGSVATPKLIGFMDGGTGRLFHHLVLLAPGEGVRQEHVIEAFLSMVAHPEWGFPRALYLDNGSEFAHLSKLAPLLNMLSEPRARTIIHAQPYNAAAKPIESLFARLERNVFSLLEGYVGGDRMKKRTANVGKAPVCYPHAFDTFKAQADQLIAAFNDRPVGGQWKGRSPQAWFAEKVAGGWRPTAVDPLVIDSLFSDQETRKVERGVVNYIGKRWTHPSLAGLPPRTVVQIAKPWRRGEAPLFQAPGLGWAYLAEDIALPAEWLDGARESRKRQKALTRNMRQLDRSAPTLDAALIEARIAERSRRVAMPRPDLSIDAGGQLASLAAAKALPKPSAPPPPFDGLTDFQRESQRFVGLYLEKKIA